MRVREPLRRVAAPYPRPRAHLPRHLAAAAFVFFTNALPDQAYNAINDYGDANFPLARADPVSLHSRGHAATILYPDATIEVRR